MDRARQTHPRPPGSGGEVLKRFLITAILSGAAAACEGINPDFSRVIAVETDGTLQQTVEESDTLQLVARAIDAAGNEVPEATIVWTILDVDSGQVGFTLDSTTGAVVGEHPGSGSVVARADMLPSALITIVVTAAPDSVALGGPQRITVPSGTLQSEALAVTIYDLTTTPGVQVPLEGKPARFAVVEPAAESGLVDDIVLTGSEIEPDEDPLVITVASDASGLATAAVLQSVGGMALPDSMIVDAVALTATGDSVAGSPIRFVVVFES